MLEARLTLDVCILNTKTNQHWQMMAEDEIDRMFAAVSLAKAAADAEKRVAALSPFTYDFQSRDQDREAASPRNAKECSGPITDANTSEKGQSNPTTNGGGALNSECVVAGLQADGARSSSGSSASAIASGLRDDRLHEPEEIEDAFTDIPGISESSTSFLVGRGDARDGQSAQSEQIIYDPADSLGRHDCQTGSDVLVYFPSAQQSPAVACSSVCGRRPQQEDAHSVERPLLSRDGEHVNLFGVFDGHGGGRCSQFLAKHLSPAICQGLERAWGGSDTAVTENTLKTAFQTVDSDFLGCLDLGEEGVGSTAVVAMLKGSHLFCAWVGDSRAVLCRANGEVLQLSQDHKPHRADERKRVQAAGGVVYNNRVMGVLGVSRSFGDKELKQWVPADPEVVSVPLRAGDDFLVLACDGLWDVADNDIVSELVRKHTAAAGLQGAACALTTFAIRNGSTDNVTCMIVQLGEKVSAKNVGDKGKVERKTVIA